MRLRVFSVVGEALNFGARRMETIMRTAWLPVVLLLIAHMATAFGLLSLRLGKVITFADTENWAQVIAAQKKLEGELLAAFLSGGPAAVPLPYWAVLGASFVLHCILIASFMAPLIRFAGLGERPGHGVVRLAFGADQLRFIAASLLSALVMAAFVFGPMATTAFYTSTYILEAVAEMRFAQFPNPESLHTIVVAPAQGLLFDAAALKPLARDIPLLAAAPFALLFWLVLTLHFRAPGSSAIGMIRTAIVALTGAGVIGAILWLLLLAGAGNVAPGSKTSHLFAILALGVMILYYASLRLVPYVGVAVCRRSLSLGGTLRVTDGFNLVRLVLALFLLGALVLAVQWVVNVALLGQGGVVTTVVQSLFGATDVYTRFVNGGETGDWVRPFFVWLWNGIKILYNIFWAFFSYGVVAGFLGRLYRDSEKA